MNGIEIAVIIIACIGLIIASYNWYVELKLAKEPTYKPVCDLSDRISCSKIINSSYSKLFGFSNSIAGIAFYLAVIALTLFGFHRLLQMLTLAGALASIGLAYIMATKIKAVCLLCTSIYVVNALLLLLSFFIK